MPKPADDFAQHARALLAKQTKPKKDEVRPQLDSAAVGGAASLANPAASKLYHPAVYHHLSMHIAERLKKLGG